MDNICKTPERVPRKILGERQWHSETRRSLFEKGDSDLSDISPLSRTSSELLSPDGNTPIKITPIRLKGISRLPPDHGLIKPSSFYGKPICSPTLDGVKLYRQIRRSLPENSKARTCLFLENLPRDKKRCRTSSGIPNESLRPDKKKIKLQPNLSHGLRKPSKSEIRHREILKRKRLIKELKEKKLQEKNHEKSKGKRKYNWEIFNTNEDLHKLTWRSSVVMTPPQSTKKARLTSSNDGDPVKLKNEVTEIEHNQPQKVLKDHDELVKEIREGVLDMMKDDDDDALSREVEGLLDKMDNADDEEFDNDDEGDNPTTICLFSEEVIANSENIDPSTPPKEMLFPIFNNSTPTNKPSPLQSRITLGSSNQKMKFGLGLNQLQLDVGQYKLREIECTGCGLIYVQGNPEDMAEHDIFHFKFKELRFNGWKDERIVRCVGLDRIVCVRSTDNRVKWKKATSVLEVIDSELGYPTQGPPTTQIYLYINDKFIRGIVAVSHITRAYKMLYVEGNDEVGLCSEEEHPVRCLISRIWVDRRFRRRSYASLLLDSVRSNFAFGSILKCSDLAFTSPTSDGKKLIETYTKTKQYFVYA